MVALTKWYALCRFFTNFDVLLAVHTTWHKSGSAHLDEHDNVNGNPFVMFWYFRSSVIIPSIKIKTIYSHSLFGAMIYTHLPITVIVFFTFSDPDKHSTSHGFSAWTIWRLIKFIVRFLMSMRFSFLAMINPHGKMVSSNACYVKGVLW